MNIKIPLLVRTMDCCRVHGADIYNLIQRGGLPRQVELGMRSVGWLESDINDWVASRSKKTESMEGQQ